MAAAATKSRDLSRLTLRVKFLSNAKGAAQQDVKSMVGMPIYSCSKKNTVIGTVSDATNKGDDARLCFRADGVAGNDFTNSLKSTPFRHSVVEWDIQTGKATSIVMIPSTKNADAVHIVPTEWCKLQTVLNMTCGWNSAEVHTHDAKTGNKTVLVFSEKRAFYYTFQSHDELLDGVQYYSTYGIDNRMALHARDADPLMAVAANPVLFSELIDRRDYGVP